MWLTHSCNNFDGVFVNTLSPRQDGRHFADDIFKCIFLNENAWILIEISLKFVHKGQVNNIPALVQITVWHRPGDKPLSEPMMVSLPTHICVTRPQWVFKSLWNSELGWVIKPHRKLLIQLVTRALIAVNLCQKTRPELKWVTMIWSRWVGITLVVQTAPPEWYLSSEYNILFDIQANRMVKVILMSYEILCRTISCGVLDLAINKVVANNKRRCLCNVFSHCLRPCSSWFRCLGSHWADLNDQWERVLRT